MTGFQLRPASRSDSRLLGDMVVEAANWDVARRRQRIAILEDPAHSRYIDGWRRPGDAGTIAVDDLGSAIGACWFRLFSADAPGYGYVAGGVPELILGVKPVWRAQGVGRALLRAAVACARDGGYARLSLSVARANHAVALYRSEGFVVVGDVGTRHTMVRTLR
ncbi:GNAT family N-acetyltransferase [Luethyella okanaganae]|uniref:GNAT family N-acetyltransferase n=1 Tax=Luethyella okanaganae TaxID=69372 RepID=A0ABW1VKX7_9MICO